MLPMARWQGATFRRTDMIRQTLHGELRLQSGCVTASGLDNVWLAKDGPVGQANAGFWQFHGCAAGQDHLYTRRLAQHSVFLEGLHCIKQAVRRAQQLEEKPMHRWTSLGQRMQALAARA